MQAEQRQMLTYFEVISKWASSSAEAISMESYYETRKNRLIEQRERLQPASAKTIQL